MSTGLYNNNNNNNNNNILGLYSTFLNAKIPFTYKYRPNLIRTRALKISGIITRLPNLILTRLIQVDALKGLSPLLHLRITAHSNHPAFLQCPTP